MKKNISSFFKDNSKWQKEYKLLRKIILDTGLDEEFKWGKPCYIFQNNNIVLIHGFKEYCAILFHKGALLKDSHKILIQQTKNTQAARQIRFTNLDEIVELETIVKEYIYEAIEVEKAGLEVDYKKTEEFEMPAEFQNKLEENKKLKTAFEALTPGRKRGYLLYFAGAKQSQTRTSRVEKYTQQILDGKGLKDR